MNKKRRKKGINKKYLGLLIMLVFIVICSFIPLRSVGHTMGITPLSVTTFDSPDVYLVRVANFNGSNTLWTGRDTNILRDFDLTDPAIGIEISQPNFMKKTEEDEYVDYKFKVGLAIRAVADNWIEARQGLEEYVIDLEFNYKGEGDFKSIEIIYYECSVGTTSISPSAESTELYLKNNFSRTSFTIHNLKANNNALIQMEMTVRYEREIDPYTGLNYSWKWLLEHWKTEGIFKGTVDFLSSLSRIAKYVFLLFIGLLVAVGVVIMGMLIYGTLERDPREFTDSIGNSVKSGAGVVYKDIKESRKNKKEEKK